MCRWCVASRTTPSCAATVPQMVSLSNGSRIQAKGILEFGSGPFNPAVAGARAGAPHFPSLRGPNGGVRGPSHATRCFFAGAPRAPDGQAGGRHGQSAGVKPLTIEAIARPFHPQECRIGPPCDDTGGSLWRRFMSGAAAINMASVTQRISYSA